MHIDRPPFWQAPNGFRKHSEGHHSKDISIPLFQLLLELSCPQFIGLRQGQSVRQSFSFNRRNVDALASSCWLIRSSDHTDNVMLSVHEGMQCSRGKVWRAKEDDAKGGVLHVGSQR